MNRVNLVGRLSDDPRLYAYGTEGQKVVYITVAVSRNYKNSKGEVEADFIKCQAFNERAERIAKYCKKGNRVGLEGQVRVLKHFNDVTNHNEYEQLINIDQIEFLEPKPKNENTQSTYQQPQPLQETTPDPFSEFGEEVIITDEDLPFN